MSADGSRANPTRVGYDRGWNTDPAWSPVGNRIAFGSDWRAFDIFYDVYVMNGDGTQITTAFAGPFSNDTTRYFQPSWSPDGRKIAVVA
jgi:TolB protein